MNTTHKMMYCYVRDKGKGAVIIKEFNMPVIYNLNKFKGYL